MFPWHGGQDRFPALRSLDGTHWRTQGLRIIRVRLGTYRCASRATTDSAIDGRTRAQKSVSGDCRPRCGANK
jgi:hypothetical protein